MHLSFFDKNRIICMYFPNTTCIRFDEYENRCSAQTDPEKKKKWLLTCAFYFYYYLHNSKQALNLSSLTHNICLAAEHEYSCSN